MPRSTGGKYDAVLPGLPKLPPSDLSYQEKVDALKASIGIVRAPALGERYAELRRQKKLAEKALYDINLEIAAYEQLLSDSKERGDAGWGEYGVNEKTLRLPSGATIRVQDEPTGKVLDKEAFRLWCVANGYERQLQLWPSTMNAIVKERLLAGEPEPDGCEAYSWTKIVFTAGE